MKKIIFLLLISITCKAQVNIVSASNSVQINSISYPLNVLTLNINRDTLFEIDYATPASSSPYLNLVVTRNQVISNCYLDGVQCTDTGTLRAYYNAHFVGSSGGGGGSPFKDLILWNGVDANSNVNYTYNGVSANRNGDVMNYGDVNGYNSGEYLSFDPVTGLFNFVNANTSDNFSFDFTNANGEVRWQNGVNGTVQYLENIQPPSTGGTGITSYSKGDIIYASGTNSLSNLNIGSGGLSLVSDGTVPLWGAPSISTLQKITSYNGISTSGNGMSYILSAVDLTSQNAATTLATFATTITGTYLISGYVNITAVVTDVLNFQVSWKDENNVSRTQVFFPMGTTSASLGTTGFVAFAPICIRALTGTNIVVSTILTTGVGSITYDCGERIIQY